MKVFPEISKLVKESKVLEVADWKLFSSEKTLKSDWGFPCRDELVGGNDELLLDLLWFVEGIDMKLLTLVVDNLLELPLSALPRFGALL